MRNLLKGTQKVIYPLLIIIICGTLAWKNYVPSTILSGWDTLHPEFNFWEYVGRAFNGVWMQHQGLGAVASQSHPAELTRLLVLYLLQFILPLNLVRYSFFFLCLTLGVFGVYFFTNFLLSSKWKKYVRPASFLASLFYLFNLTTVQQFYVPLEMFAVHYATLPWLFLLASKYIQKKETKTLLWFAVIGLFSSSMAHTATLFYVYLLCLVLFTVILSFKKSVILVGLTLLVNSFWILPNLYFIKNHSQDVASSKIHTVFTGEAILQSEAYGTFQDLALSKNFLFNWNSFDFSKNEFTDLLGVWKTHLNKPYVVQIGYSLFVLAMVGLIVSVFTKSKYSLALVLPFCLSVFFWINSNYPWEPLFDYLQNNVSLFREGLRFPFTKFSIMLVMILSVWFGYTSQFVFKILGKVKIGFIYLFVIVLGLIYFQLPQFNDYLISPLMKVTIPNEYFEVFNWFGEQDQSGRVARLPMDSYWGWQYNSWGYQGAGFSWFGIKQPVLEREFDRWSPHNETFYNQTSRALYNGQPKDLKEVLEKYQVRYLFLDESIITAGGDPKLLQVPEIISTANSLGYKKVFEKDFLTVYDTGIVTKNFISAPKSYTFVDVDLTYSQVDPIYEKYGTYVQPLTIDHQSLAISYPFVNFDNRSAVEVSIMNNELSIENKKANTEVRLPIENKLVETFEEGHGFETAKNCDLKENGVVERERLISGRNYKAEDGGVSCDYFVFDNIASDSAHVVHIAGKNKQGRSLKIYLYDWESKRVVLEELLPEQVFDSYFVVYPNNTNGYTLNVETRSFGKVSSENEINEIELIPFDIDTITFLVKSDEITNHQLPITNQLQIKNVKKYGTAIYKVDVEGYGLLQLGQGYESGWLALQIPITKFQLPTKLQHVKVNSWSNGWLVPSNILRPTYHIYLVFWPLVLEWLGLLLLGITLLFLLLRVKNQSDA